MTQNNQNSETLQDEQRKAVATQIEREFNMSPRTKDNSWGKYKILLVPGELSEEGQELNKEFEQARQNAALETKAKAELNATFGDEDVSFVAPITEVPKQTRVRAFKPREYLPFKRCVRVFDPDEIAQVKASLKNIERDARTRLEPVLKNAENHAGYRSIPDFKGNELSKLRSPFRNFTEVLNHFSGEMAVAGAGKPESFRITPVLLDGAPGVGKTAFAMAFANMLGLPFVKMSAGGMQHAAVLAGTAQHWGNSQPGGVFNLLSKSDSAAAVLLIDEVDKLSNWTGYSLLPALLELLEPESSSKYVDESLRLTFDASRLIVLMTSNSTQHMDLALVSRCQVFTIDLPDVDQKMLVAREAHDKTNKSMPARNRLDLDVDALRRLAENDIDIRTLLMSVRNGWARAIENGSKIVVPEMPRKIEKKNQIGFMKGS